MSAVNDISELINCLNEALSDAEKHDRGNAAAGTRLRKCLFKVCCSANKRLVKWKPISFIHYFIIAFMV